MGVRAVVPSRAHEAAGPSRPREYMAVRKLVSLFCFFVFKKNVDGGGRVESRGEGNDTKFEDHDGL